MNYSAEIAARFGRICAGNQIHDDYIALFLWLREARSLHPFIRDIGDFIAHRHQRERGHSFDSARDLVDQLIFKIYPLACDASNVLFSADKLDVTNHLRAALNTHKRLGIKDDLRLNPAVRKKLLESAIAKMGSIHNNELHFLQSLTAKERGVFDKYFNTFILSSFMNEKELFHQFIKCMTRNGYQSKISRESAESIQGYLALFAIEQMHNVSMVTERMPSNIRCITRADIHSVDGNPPYSLSTSFEVSLDTGVTPPTVIVATGFETTLDPFALCEPQLLSLPRWDIPIEINQNGKLQAIF